METDTRPRQTHKLTEKGQATRARILEHAANLIYTQGVHATNNEQLRRVAGVSGSQLNHYFPNKESLLLAVIDWQADGVLAFHRSDKFGGFDTIDAFREWADFYVAHGRPFQDGCSLGSLASEIIKTDLDVHQQLAATFEQWRDIFRDGLERMQRLGRLDATADPTRLAHALLAAYQGGMLLAQVARDIAPLRDALYAAVDYLETFAIYPDTDEPRAQ
ncbi:TetR/AcrR family transcriptional regulator [Amycolatopsis sp. NPDC051903]|uniref:TetR/AcrR family transcriptional regulator n=1 Tax=Amycolatopsis sp. NPDC051903 TaxID=3363936 RepID=UPI0037BA1BD2